MNILLTWQPIGEEIHQYLTTLNFAAYTTTPPDSFSIPNILF